MQMALTQFENVEKVEYVENTYIKSFLSSFQQNQTMVVSAKMIVK